MWQQFKTTKFFAVIKNKYFLVTLVFLLWICFFDANNLIDWGHSIVKLANNRAEQRYYREQIDSTESQLLELKSNKDSLEKFAREKYYFQQDDEDVFIVSPAE